MKTCHVRGFACENDAENCIVCGAELKTFEAYEQDLKEKEEIEEKVIERPVLLATLDDIVSAEILRDILNSNSIPNSGCESSEGAMKVVFGGGFVAEEIYVADADLEKANELYEEFLNTEIEFDDDFSEDFGEEI